MILFAVYAVFVWYLAMRYRRRWLGFAIVLVGAALCLLLAKALMKFDTFLGGGPRLVQHLIWGESALVLVVGLFVASLPRPPSGRHCAYCWYDLRGLESESGGSTASAGPGAEPVCPECGEPLLGWGKRGRAPARTAGQGGSGPRG
ncbi:MAG: hypothetical protein ACT4PL_11800 [Phycisphaerales bacterium]